MVRYYKQRDKAALAIGMPAHVLGYARQYDSAGAIAKLNVELV